MRQPAVCGGTLRTSVGVLRACDEQHRHMEGSEAAGEGEGAHGLPQQAHAHNPAAASLELGHDTCTAVNS